MNHPAILLLAILGGWYLAKLWRDDWKMARRGEPAREPLPGATSCPPAAIWIGAAGGILLVAIETAGEYQLGVFEQQSKITWLFALYSISAAPVIEEVIFRGWLLIENRGRLVLWSGVLGASLVFALLHPFLWRWEEAGFQLALEAKGGFSTAVVFVTSLWLYYGRVARWNPQRSLLPCFAGHIAKNVSVVAVKAATGYVAGLW